MNQIGCESSSTYDYNEDEEPIIPYGVDAFEMIPQYYMEDHLGQVKPVYQASAFAPRGQNINSFVRRPPLQCYDCGGPHHVAEYPNRLQRNATPVQVNQEGTYAMPLLTLQQQMWYRSFDCTMST